MKHEIHITGQISGNIRLINSIPCYANQQSKGMFNSYKITFKSKQEARKALYTAWKSLKDGEPDFVKRSDYNPKFLSLRYDASVAK